MTRLWRWLTTRTERLRAVDAGWITVEYRRITGRVVRVTVQPDGHPVTELGPTTWQVVTALRLAGDPQRLHDEARTVMHMPALSRLLADFCRAP